MNRNFTRIGVLRLGQLIRESIEAQGWTQQDLMAKMAEMGYIADRSAVSRMLGGKMDKPDGAMVLTIADMGITKKPSGEPYSFRELMLIACESVDPATGEQISNGRI